MKVIIKLIALWCLFCSLLIASQPNEHMLEVPIIGTNLILGGTIQKNYDALNIPKDKIERFSEDYECVSTFKIITNKYKVKRKYRTVPKFNNDYQISQIELFYDKHMLVGLLLDMKEIDGEQQFLNTVELVKKNGYKRVFPSVFKNYESTPSDYFKRLKEVSVEGIPKLDKFKGKWGYGKYKPNTVDIYIKETTDYREVFVFDIYKNGTYHVKYLIGKKSSDPFLRVHLDTGIKNKGSDLVPAYVVKDHMNFYLALLYFKDSSIKYRPLFKRTLEVSFFNKEKPRT
ncbi:hypothetical protein DID80_06755 [Candidatus Marinamargulisbacteria bacterium SCGC AAA071-K20]|nr:hypothetical protein DID80_06755 [Candidatus Marinamargulisbacteria bacterium SCGC AAA071-K20]